jgi:hypothetical protein
VVTSLAERLRTDPDVPAFHDHLQNQWDTADSLPRNHAAIGPPTASNQTWNLNAAHRAASRYRSKPAIIGLPAAAVALAVSVGVLVLSGHSPTAGTAATVAPQASTSVGPAPIRTHPAAPSTAVTAPPAGAAAPSAGGRRADRAGTSNHPPKPPTLRPTIPTQRATTQRDQTADVRRAATTAHTTEQLRHPRRRPQASRLSLLTQPRV